MLKRLILLLILITVTGACNLIAEDADPVPTETPIPTATGTSTPEPTPEATVEPSETAVPTETPLPTATATPQATATPPPPSTATLPPTNTLIPVNTPLPTAERAPDDLELIDLPDTLIGGPNRPLVVFVNQNDSVTIRNLSTAQPENQEEILYIADPRNPANRVEVARFSGDGNTPVFLAPNGSSLAYFIEGTGLYVLDTTSSISLRVVRLGTLAQRGISTRPTWRSDGRFLAVTLETGYSLDISGYDLDAGTWTPLVQDGSYNFWPSFSPDGRYLAFVSDRVTCPTWNPNDANACEDGVDPSPVGGLVHLLDLQSGGISLLSDQPTFEPPYWLNNRELFFTSGDPLELLDPERRFFVATIADLTTREIRLNGTGETPNYLAESWSDDGQRVIFQRAAENTTEIIAMSASGDLLERFDDLSFARFSMRATWAPNGERVAVGGSSGQCPYGVRVFDRNFDNVGRGGTPPSMCNPQFSPDSSLIAYTGIDTSRGDGRVDVYTTTANGFDRVGLTFDLRGSMRLIGWIAP